MTTHPEATRIATAILDKTVIPAPGDLTLAEAYEIQEGVLDAMTAAGQARVGAKIGISAPAAQKAFGLSEPVSGLLFEPMLLTDGAEIAAGAHVHPRVEAEICFRLGADLDDPALDEAAAAAAIDQVLPAIEVVNSRFEGWSGGPLHMVAENVSAAWFVIGEPAEGVDPATLANCTMVMTQDGAEVSTGAGAATHGGPLPALVWLARDLIKRGRPLKAGDYVMSGAFAAMHPVGDGREVRVDLAGVGSVSVRFGA